jgi:hypothetical protein
MSRPIVFCSRLPIFHFCITTHCSITAPHSMVEETTNKPLPVNSSTDEDDAKNDSGPERIVRVTSSSPTRGAALMANGMIPEMPNFFKKMIVTDTECQGYHDLDWLTGSLLSFIPEVDVPTVDSSIVLCFESHLTARLGLPPSKFLISITNFLGCSLIHFNPNALATLSSFTMLCECWLGIPPDSNFFWYYYSLTCYNQMIYGWIGLSLWCHRRGEYIKAAGSTPSVDHHIAVTSSLPHKRPHPSPLQFLLFLWG